MKNYLFICFTTTFLVCINSNIHTQSPANLAKTNATISPENLFPSSKQFNPTSKSGFIFRNDINIKAVRNFIKYYGDVTDVTWRQTGSGPAAYFTMNDIRTYVYFYKNGDYSCMIQYYYEDKLPQNIRKLVKSRYYDYSITSIAELNKDGKTNYDVKIEYKTSCKTIRVTGGEMEVREEFLKPSGN